jgi:uncharacterized repeat protein (TIGR03943 family)
VDGYIRAAVLLGLAALIGHLFTAGEMAKYMSPALDPLTALAGLVLALMGLFELWQVSRRPTVSRHSHQIGVEDEASDGGPFGAPAGHWSEQLMTASMIVAPILVGLLVTPRALGAGALGGEPISGLLLTLPPVSSASRPEGAPPPAAAIADVDELLRYLREHGERSVGQRIRVVGIMMPGSDLADDELALLRFSIAHCVADARPLALLIVSPAGRVLAAESGALDQWLLVEGRLATRERDGDRLVTIEAERVERTSEPANPYLRAAF